MTDVLRVHDLSVGFLTREGLVQAVRELSFSIAHGETVGLIGESGSGKTTVVKSILRLLPQAASIGGEVTFEGRNVFDLTEAERRRLCWEKVALVPQAAMNSLDPVQPVDRQLAEVVRAHRKMSRKGAVELAQEALDKVGIHRDRSHAYPHQFSGGMRQRALIAAATILQPTLLIADEPTTGLDVIVQDRIMELLAGAQRELGSSMLLVTHDLGVAAELCDRVVVLKDGSAVESGTVTEVFAEPAHEYTRELLDLTPATVTSSSRAPTGPGAEPVVTIADVSVTYAAGRGLASLRRTADIRAVDDVSLKIRPGEIVGIAGESGCGKSSLASSLVGLADIATGRLGIDGVDIDPGQRPDWRSLRSRIQLVFQDPYQSLNPRFTVRRAVAEPLLAQRRLTEAEVDRLVDRALSAAELKPPELYADRRPHELSGGERQRVAIARALVVEPRVLIADEPVSMLDHSTGREITRLLRHLADDLQVAILLVSHDLSVLERVCDRIAIMYLGRIVETGPVGQVVAAPKHPYTQALLAAVPSRDPAAARSRVLLPGDLPSPVNRPSGCPFHPRCPVATHARCRTQTPELEDHPHEVACWNVKASSPHTPAARIVERELS